MSNINPLLFPARECGWKIESAARGVAGTLVLLSLAFSRLDSRCLWLTVTFPSDLTR